MQTDEETLAADTGRRACPSEDREPLWDEIEALEGRLSPERLKLLERTLNLRRRIGIVSTNVADLVHDMREQGD